MKKRVNIKILKDYARKAISIPQYSTSGSAGLDIRVILDDPINLHPKDSVLLSTGIAIHMEDEEMAAIILPRSGLAHKFGIILNNSVGLIDSDYQGEIMIPILNNGKDDFLIQPGYRIAQIVFFPIVKVEFEIVQSFSKISSRNNRGFGHSGI
ncbi:dUTP diphosphatase [Candidatus Riesia pediculischaeffi]|uniref:Deoxyuridine 5'-triphosphate nucleotidohydrolase n=1 Tax=Candidatus Riesia pediculischaeffi PTSU TaxID=1401651 RepID=A0A0C1VKC1_9ENTR|nr:dUTP diphosphatase [Candidatus Riesia pediculischaeffi]KIE64290.1 Deoxyuridine 5'-triphosphate nucleotidohydrolase [Candidatus Riesia pediculischaeffi PTSU]